MSLTDVVFVLRGPSEKVQFSMTPEEIEINDEARDTVVSLLDADYASRSGKGLTTYSWSGMLPGRGRQNFGYVKSHIWEPPEDIRKTLRRWVRNKAVVNFEVEGTHIRNDVRVVSFTSRHSGGLDDIRYSISLREHRKLEVHRKHKKKKGKKRDGSSHGKKGDKPSRDGDRRTYVATQGDTLQTVARRFLGSTTMWRDIYALNSSVVGTDPDALLPGTELVIPS